MPNLQIGIIAEDDSDVDCLKSFIKRILANKQVSFKKFVGQGCGKISKKAHAWAEIFKAQGCTSLILLHDLDRNNKTSLLKKLNESLLPSPIEKYLICIPIEELEAWLLSDANAIKQVFNINQNISLPANPETTNSPKEFLGKFVRKETNKKVDYINTRHNLKIAEIIDISLIFDKCSTFQQFQNFIKTL